MSTRSRPERAREGPHAPLLATSAKRQLGVIRVVVLVGQSDLRTQDGPRGPASGRTQGGRHGPAPMAAETTAALARLGDPVEILRVASLDELADQLRDPTIDLVLVDRAAPDAVEEWLAAVPEDGPPSVVVVADDAEDAALAAFRAGAADCVHFGPDYERVLPVVMLEQVRRWRAVVRRRMSESRIRWLEELNAAIVSEMPAGLAVVDAQGLIVAVNPEFERIFPSRSSEAGASEPIAARLPRELVEAIEGDKAADGGLEASSGGAGVELVRLEEEPRSVRAFEIRRRALDDEGRVLLLISDVTESEWLSERLEALRRDHRDIIENINSALIVVDRSGRVSFANPAAERILGGDSDDVLGRHVGDWFGQRDPAPAPGHGGARARSSPIEDCLAEGTRSRGAETFMRRPDGHWMPVGISCSPRLDAAGRRQGVVAVFQDLSEIKELELQVRQSEKMASIGQLAAGVAHEVNNPMGFIHANLHQMSEYLSDLGRVLVAVDRLQEAVGEEDVEAIRAASTVLRETSREVDLDYVRADFQKALLESLEGSERIRHIVKDLRDFSRPDLPARSATDVNQAIDSTANIVWTMLKHSVLLEKEYGDLPDIQAYPMQLKQVFMNLLVNAYQAIEARGDEEPGVIRIETSQDGAEAVIRVSDTGVGIEPDDRLRIFEPFFTTKPAGAGTGLGLSTSFSIVERHGGRIGVESEPGQGTTFELRLPIAGAGPAETTSGVPTGPVDG